MHEKDPSCDLYTIPEGIVVRYSVCNCKVYFRVTLGLVREMMDINKR